MLHALSYVKEIFVWLPKEDSKRRKKIDAVCRGWSGKKHWKAFKNLFTEHRHIQDICVLGVYLSRDIAYMTTILNELGRDYKILGVDLFADVPGPDWPEKKRDQSWEEAGFGIPPSMEKATQNLTGLRLNEHVELLQANALEFLESTDQQFDLIYIDVSHDYQTTQRGIELARPRLKPNGILGGDDFYWGTWAVAKAVKELCPNYELHYGWIWWDKSAAVTQAASLQRIEVNAP